MKTPISSSSPKCYNRLKYIQNIDATDEEVLVENIKEDFDKNLSHRKVYINGIDNVFYDAWIYNGNKPENIVGWKYFLSYPYDNIQFEIGDVIYWKYKDKTDTYYPWLLTSFDTQHYYDAKGKIYLCNNTLKKYDSGILAWTEPCVYTDKFSNTNIDEGSAGVPQISGQIRVWVQNNTNTSTIEFDDRFTFNNTTFQITQINNHIAPKFLELFMKVVPSLESELEEAEENDKVIISPNDALIILEGNTQVYDVYDYVDGIPNGDTFSITASGINPLFYVLMPINGSISATNSFSVENLGVQNEGSRMPLNSPLIITCTNNRTGETSEINIILGGKW